MAIGAMPGLGIRCRLMAPTLLWVALVLGAAAPADAQTAETPGAFTLEQATEIEAIVHRYLLEHPEVLVEALTAYQQREKVAEQERQRAAVTAHRDELTASAGDPVLGNPDGDVVIVEFFDYRCPYCRNVAEPVRKAVEEDGNVRLVMKEFPILGPQSLQAARAALAAIGQDRYEAFHFALMQARGDLSDPRIMQVAREVGLDVERLEREMQDESIDAIIRRNHDLARALGITGTPAFVVGATLVPGAIDEASLKRLIAQARAKGS